MADPDYFVFNAGEGKIINISILGWFATFYDADLEQVPGTDYIEPYFIYHTAYETPASTVWYLALFLYMGPPDFQFYTINFSLHDQDDLGTSGDAPGDLVNATDLGHVSTISADGILADLDTRDCYKFTAGQGEVIEMTLAQTAPEELTVKLLDAAEDLVFTLGIGGGYPLRSRYYTAHETPLQEWYIVVEKGSPNGSYPLNIELLRQNDAESDSDAASSPLEGIEVSPSGFSGMLRDLDKADVYRVKVNPHDTLVVNLTNEAGPASLGLVLMDQDQTTVETVQAPPMGDAEITALVPGTTPSGSYWYINVSMTGDEGQNYSIRVSIEDHHPPTIAHTPPEIWYAGEGKGLEAVVTDNVAVAEVKVLYRVTGIDSYTELPMVFTNETLWFATIPASAVTSVGLQYYLWATDGANEATFPAGGLEDPIDVTNVRVPDIEPPEIAHTTPDQWTEGSPRGITATIMDNEEVISARLFYRAVGGANFTMAVMVEGADDNWSAEIPGEIVTTDGVEYYIWATDGANSATFPEGGEGDPIVVTDIAGLDEVPPTIAHTTPSLWVKDEPRAVEATITDNVQVASAKLYHRKKGETTFAETAMVLGTGDVWSAEVPGSDVTTAGVEYYLWATDGINEVTFPADGASDPIEVTDIVEPDTVPPVITHTTPTGWVAGSARKVEATITDDVDVTSAKLFYRVKGTTSYVEVAMTEGTGDVWSADVPAANVTTAGVEYYVWATDGQNPVTFPAGGETSPVSITDVSIPDTVGPVIEHTGPATPEAGKALTMSATVTDATSVGTVKLYYRAGTSGAFKSVNMELDGGQWRGTVPKGDVKEGTLQYYIEAADILGNRASRGNETAPLSVNVAKGAGEEEDEASNLLLWGLLVVVLVVIVALILFMVMGRRRAQTGAPVAPPPAPVAPIMAPGAEPGPVAGPAPPATAPPEGAVAAPVVAPAAPAPVQAPAPAPTATGSISVINVNTYCDACGGSIPRNTPAYVCSCGSAMHEKCAGMLGSCPKCKNSIRL